MAIYHGYRTPRNRVDPVWQWREADHGESRVLRCDRHLHGLDDTAARCEQLHLRETRFGLFGEPQLDHSRCLDQQLSG